VLAIVVVEQPITRAEITARRMAGSDRQVQVLLQQHRLVREEPHAALPGRGIPLITTDLLLRRLGMASIGELLHRKRFPSRMPRLRCAGSKPVAAPLVPPMASWCV
jgi:chromosome segregation and condensation protein ScpB